MKKNIKETYKFLQESVNHNTSSASVEKLSDRADWSYAKQLINKAFDVYSREGEYSNLDVDSAIDKSTELFTQAEPLIINMATKEEIINALKEIDNNPWMEFQAWILKAICDKH